VANAEGRLGENLAGQQKKELAQAIREAKAVLAAEAPKISRRMNGAELPEMIEAVNIAKQLEKAIAAENESLMRRLTFSVKQASKRADEAEKQAKERGKEINYARRSTASAQETVRSGKYRNATRVVTPIAPTSIYNVGVGLYNKNREGNARFNAIYALANPNYGAAAKAKARWIGRSAPPNYPSLRPNMQKVPNNDNFLRKLAEYNAKTYGAPYGKGGRRITRSQKSGRKSSRKAGRKSSRKLGRKTRRAL
jgi:hypothetical protein